MRLIWTWIGGLSIVLSTIPSGEFFSYHDTKYDANRAAMNNFHGLSGSDVVSCHRDDLSFYLGDNANA